MTMPLMTHYDEDCLESYAMGRLREETAAELEEHLLLCEQCQERLERVDDFIRAFRIASNRTAASPAPGPLAASKHWLSQWLGGTLRPLPVAGVMAMAALALVMVAPRRDGWPATADEAAGRVSLSAMRGAEATARVAAHRRVELDLDAGGLERSSYRVELADARGRQLWQASLATASGRIAAAVPNRLPVGNYWIRLYDPDSGQLVREFGLRAQ